MTDRTQSQPITVQKFLRGADYPMSRDELLHLADQNGAPNEIMDVLRSLPDVDFEGPTDVQEAYGETEEISQARRANEEYRQKNGRQDSDRQNNRHQDRRPKSNGTPAGRNARGEEADDPNPDVISSRRRVKDEDIEDARQAYEARKKKRQQEQDDDDAEWDRRLKGHETDSLSDARHMRHGYDGRGRVRNEETDHRLKGNETQALSDARHMRHGYDGRGRVRKFGPGNLEERMDDDRERYEQNNQGPEPDEETGSYSHRRKDDMGRMTGRADTSEQRYAKRKTWREHNEDR